ncbi:ATP-binding protein [Caenimonas soli]|uniref:ATP-binding protein n=1 Tax=Caenimonas soli TaxID=2735555 RepID=UPI00155749D4|nr:ATP-binding protein [Caenimonas soli]NPC56902.1 ATP-binding protein [Caenimonas soli]
MIALPSIYTGNILIEACGPIPTEKDLVAGLVDIPARSEPITNWQSQSHLALHEMQALEGLFVPPKTSKDIALTVGLGVRNGYRVRNPAAAETASMIRGRPPSQFALIPPWMMSVCGIPGIGKSQSILRSLMQFPGQVIEHTSFPGVVGPFLQLIYLHIDVPGTGRLIDLAKALMRATDEALQTDEFAEVLRAKNSRPWDLFNRWLQVARRHFLGVVFFDEAQNLFKLETKRERERIRKTETRPQALRLIEDATLKAILNIANTWKIPVGFSMMPEGLAAFETRLAATQRLCSEGHHEFSVATSAEDWYSANQLLPELELYQYLPQRMTIGPVQRQAIYEATAYNPRIMIKAWKMGQRVAIEKNSSRFKIEHIRAAMDTYLAPLKPAVKALLSKDPERLQMYQDLLPPPKFWQSV